MEMKRLSNPFVVGRYISDHYFCDRREETEFLIKQIENGRNVALISPRRMGKTGLIRHCFNQEVLKEQYRTFFVDIYATGSLAEFVYLLGKAVYEELKPGKKQWVERFFQVVRSLRVGLKWDAMTGEPGLDIGLGDIQEPQTTLDEIFEYLETADKPYVVAIDEFQQIATYEEQNVEALLRTRIQQCRQTTFLFAGSQRHLMGQMFNTASKPFYQSAICTGLNPIPLAAYRDFAMRMFEEEGRQIDPAVVEKVYCRFEGCTWFVQMMMNELFALTAKDGRCGLELLETAWQNVILTQENSYKDLLSRLAPKQKMLLQAIAREGTARGITSAAFIRKYSLPSASSVQSALKPLLKNDLVTQQDDAYRVYDYFLAEWLKKEY